MAATLADDIHILKYNFVDENVWISISISLNFVPGGPIDNKKIIGSGHGLAPNRRQAITWTNDDRAQWRIYGSGHGSLAVLLPGFAINW